MFNRLGLIGLILIAALAPVSFAQSDRGTMTGTVADSTGAVNASVPVQVKNTVTGVAYDGATSNTGTPGVAAQTQPSVDAIQEIANQTSNYAAEYGQAGGGVLNLTMKSGGNQFHGSAYDYFINEDLNAGNNFAVPARPRNRRNDY